jgi:lipoprotein LprG
LVRQSKILISVLGVLFLVVMLISCKGTKTATLAPVDIIDQSSAKLQTVNAYHFALDQVGGGTPIGMGVEMKKAEGDILSPDKLKTTITGTVSGMTVQVQIISVGGVMKMTNPLSGKWEVPSSSFNVLSLFDPKKGIAAILKNLADISKLDDAQSGGVLSYHLSGTIKSENLSAITGSSIAGTSIATELWIGKDDLLVRNIKLTGKITETEVQGIVRTLGLSNFNESVTIDLPQ